MIESLLMDLLLYRFNLNRSIFKGISFPVHTFLCDTRLLNSIKLTGQASIFSLLVLIATKRKQCGPKQDYANRCYGLVIRRRLVQSTTKLSSASLDAGHFCR